jgi:hypothetical protein
MHNLPIVFSTKSSTEESMKAALCSKPGLADRTCKQTFKNEEFYESCSFSLRNTCDIRS